jgi:hypothetical protein
VDRVRKPKKPCDDKRQKSDDLKDQQNEEQPQMPSMSLGMPVEHQCHGKGDNRPSVKKHRKHPLQENVRGIHAVSCRTINNHRSLPSVNTGGKSGVQEGELFKAQLFAAVRGHRQLGHIIMRLRL